MTRPGFSRLARVTGAASALPFRIYILAAGLYFLLPRSSRAAGSLTYKYEDYQESGGRIGVLTRQALLEQNFGPDLNIKVGGVIDAIAGATPDGQPAPAGSDQVPLSQLHDRRKAWNGDISRQFSRINLDLGIANSRESDYISTGWSVNTLTDFNEKNTTLLAGVAGTDDDVKVFFQPRYVKKRTNDVIVGLTQLIDPLTRVSLNFSWGRATGFLSDPYKLVQRDIEVLPGIFLARTYGENRPDERNKEIVYLEINRDFPALRGAVQGTYRFYNDSFGTEAHTGELAWFERLGPHWTLNPSLRYYQQSAARFYHYQIDSTNIFPTFGPPNPAGPFYSSDFRVSALRTSTVGFKVVYDPVTWLQLDAAWEFYDMQGRDHITPESAYARARIITLGGRVSW